MTSIEIARLYKEVVTLHDAIPESESTAKDLVASFRSNIHYELMDVFRHDGVEFQTRGEAARIAFEMASEEYGKPTTEIGDYPMTPLTLSPARVQQLYDQFLEDAKEYILSTPNQDPLTLPARAQKYALGRAVERCAEITKEWSNEYDSEDIAGSIRDKIRGGE